MISGQIVSLRSHLFVGKDGSEGMKMKKINLWLLGRGIAISLLLVLLTFMMNLFLWNEVTQLLRQLPAILLSSPNAPLSFWGRLIALPPEVAYYLTNALFGVIVSLICLGLSLLLLKQFVATSLTVIESQPAWTQRASTMAAFNRQLQGWLSLPLVGGILLFYAFVVYLPFQFILLDYVYLFLLNGFVFLFLMRLVQQKTQELGLVGSRKKV